MHVFLVRNFRVKIMAKNNRITLILEGIPEEEGRIRLSTFLSELGKLSSALGRIPRENVDGVAATVFNIEELSYNSPMTVVLAPPPGQGQLAADVLRSFEAIADAVTAGTPLDGYDSELLSDIRAMAKPVGSQLKYATLIINGNTFDLNESVARHIDAALEVDDECVGFVEGRLEQINIHDGTNMFHIYPDTGPRKVACHFPDSLLDEAVFAIGRKVEVSGMMKYRHGASFPHTISVTAIDPSPPEDELPNWEDLRGRAPNVTGGLSSEAFVRKLRDAWE